MGQTTTELAASNYVSGKFTAATAYADAAKADLSTFLTSMATAIEDFTGQAFSIDYLQFPANYAVTIDSSINKPVRPTIAAQSIPATPTTLETTVEHEEITTASVIGANFNTRLNGALTASKILTAPEEQALYDRAAGRRDADNLRIEDDATNLWAARGFEVPSGALTAIMAAAQREIARNNLELSAEVLGKSAELAMQAASVALQVSASFEQAWLAHLDQINDRAVKVKFQNVASIIQTYVSVAKVVTDIYLNDVQAYGALMSTELGIEQVQLAGNENATKNQAMKHELLMKEAELRIKEKQATLQLQLDSLKTSATLSAQVVASALNSVNASASFGFSGSVNDSTSSSESWDRTKGIVTKIVSENVSHTGDGTVDVVDTTVSRVQTVIPTISVP